MKQLMDSTERMKSEEYKKLFFDIGLKDSRYLLDFFPPTVASSLISVDYVLEIYVSFKGLTLPNKKPV